MITRYAFSDVGKLDENPEGDWVKYEDVKEMALLGAEIAVRSLVQHTDMAKLVMVSEGRKETIGKLEEIVRASATAGCLVSQSYVTGLDNPESAQPKEKTCKENQ